MTAGLIAWETKLGEANDPAALLAREMSFVARPVAEFVDGHRPPDRVLPSML